MAFRKSQKNLKSFCIIILGLSSFEAFAIPPVPDWVQTRWVNTSQSKKVQEVTDPSLLYHDPKCAPFLCIRQKKRRKITWNPEAPVSDLEILARRVCPQPSEIHRASLTSALLCQATTRYPKTFEGSAPRSRHTKARLDWNH